MEYRETEFAEDKINPSEIEHDTLLLAINGDAGAIANLYDLYQEKIFRYLRSQVSDHQLAEDFTGEVFKRMLIGLPQYKPTSAPFQSWLFRIARNLLIDYHRTEKKRLPVSLEHIQERSGHAGEPDAELDRKLAQEQLSASLLELPGEQRQVIVLRFLVKLPIKEVAEIVGKTEAAVKALQHRGLAALKLSFSQLEE